MEGLIKYFVFIDLFVVIFASFNGTILLFTVLLYLFVRSFPCINATN